MRLLSYNIHKGVGGGDRLYRLDRVMKVVEEHEPDIVCLQEVDRNVKRSNFHDQPLMFAEKLTCDHCYQLNVPSRKGGYGNLILSRWPISVSHHVNLTMGSKKPRGAQIAIMETPQGKIRIVNWHLGLLEVERNWQAMTLFEHSIFKQDQDLPTIIAGDTNDWRNVLHKRAFEKHDYHHYSGPPKLYRSFPAYFPLGSLDKAFGRGVKVEKTSVARGGLARWASDHLPLIVDFHLPHHAHAHAPGHSPEKHAADH